MQFADFEKNCAFLSPPLDPFFQILLKLRVWVGDMDELAFKLATLSKLRTKPFYKRLKPSVVERIENGLLSNFTPLSFWAACTLYDLNVRVVQSPYYLDCGEPNVMWRNGKLQRTCSIGLFQLQPLKPLYAISHYKVADLKAIAGQLGVHESTKTEMYANIQGKLAELA
jgi:hypothetical protein